MFQKGSHTNVHGLGVYGKLHLKANIQVRCPQQVSLLLLMNGVAQWHLMALLSLERQCHLSHMHSKKRDSLPM